MSDQNKPDKIQKILLFVGFGLLAFGVGSIFTLIVMWNSSMEMMETGDCKYGVHSDIFGTRCITASEVSNRQIWLEANLDDPHFRELFQSRNWVVVEDPDQQIVSCPQYHDVVFLGKYYYSCVPQQFIKDRLELHESCNPFDSTDCELICIDSEDASVFYPLVDCEDIIVEQGSMVLYPDFEFLYCEDELNYEGYNTCWYKRVRDI